MNKRRPTLKLKSLRQMQAIRSGVARLGAQACAVADRIAELAEPGMREFKSSALLEDFLAANGFRVSRPWKNLPTAFKAIARIGGKTSRATGPTIALLAEYDALPDCGERPGRWGHGCGHNLLGAGAALAGVVAAQVLRRTGLAAQIVVFGCPAEEMLSGKVYMAAGRAFAGLGAVLAWHPAGETRVNAAGGAAMDSILLRFRGRTAHAASAHGGRSALDAAMLTDVAINYLREHVESNVRIHGIITEGGKAPNVVPDAAESWYYVRGKDRKQVDELRGRVLRCARGAATATETSARMIVKDCVTERIRNKTLAEMLDALLRRWGAPRFSPADARAAAKVLPKKKYCTKIVAIKDDASTASSDEDNVSWFAPLNCVNVACVPVGVTGHHRNWAGMCRISGAHRGLRRAAEVLAAAAVELVLNRPLLRKALAEFRRNRKGRKYSLPISPAVMRRLGSTRTPQAGRDAGDSGEEA